MSDYISPMIVEEHPKNVALMDVFSKLMMSNIIFLGAEIDAYVANIIIGQLLYLEDKEDVDEIVMYINSPGGDVISGFAIYDTMQHIKTKIKTVAIGQASSMASILLAAGDVRVALPHAEILIHQPRGGMEGKAEDIKVTAKLFQKYYIDSARVIAKHTKQPYRKVYKDMGTEYYMDAQEALKYGIIDAIVE